MNKVIVTGANGFVGSWLCNYLTSKEIKVLAIVRNTDSDISYINNNNYLNILYSDLSDIKNTISKSIDDKYDVFIHLAWDCAGGKGRSDYVKQLTNIMYACDAAKIAKEVGCYKFISVGTITEKIAQKLLEMKNKSDNIIYGICKNTTHQILDVITSKIGIDFVWLTLSNLYGPYSNNGNIVEYALKNMVSGKIPKFTSALQPYDLMYIEDLVKAIYLIAINYNTKKEYYVGSGNPRILKEYLEDIRMAYNKEAVMEFGVIPDDGISYDMAWFNTSDLIKDTNFSCDYTFKEGIEKTIKWIKEINVDGL